MKKGTTTRIIDRCIQELFTNGFTYVYDGRGTETMKQQTDIAKEKLIDRLELEHKNAKYVSRYGNYSGIDCWKIETHNL